MRVNIRWFHSPFVIVEIGNCLLLIFSLAIPHTKFIQLLNPYKQLQFKLYILYLILIIRVMADYQDDWDRDDYGFDEDQNSIHSAEDYNDVQSVPDDLKAEEDSELSLSDGQNDNDSSNGNQGSEQVFIDLVDDQPAFAVANKIKITNPYLSKYQKAAIIGKRAQQISKNSPIYTSISINQLKKMNPLQIAQKQFNERKIPYIIRRYLPNGQFEDWKFSQLKH